MKIAAIQGYTGKGYTTGFGKKEENPKTEPKISYPHSTRASILKMLPVMMAMAGMQPVAASTTLNADAPQYFPILQAPPQAPKVYPKTDSRYDPQYDGESEYLHLNLNELYFYAFINQRSPKLIDLNELFDVYMDSGIDWKKLKRDFKFSTIDMANIQSAIDYFEKLYKYKQIKRKEAILNGQQDPYSPEKLNRRERLRAHYRPSDILATYTLGNMSNIYTTEAMKEAVENAPGYVDGKLVMAMKDFKENYPEVSLDDVYKGNKQELEYKIEVGGIGDLIAGANTQIEILKTYNEYLAKNLAENPKVTSTEGSSDIAFEDSASDVDNNTVTPTSDYAPPAAETKMMKAVFNDLQNILYTRGIEPGNAQILEETDDNVKMKVKTNSFTTLLDVRQADEKIAYTSGILETNDALGKRKMEMLAMTGTDGEIIYAFFRDVNTDEVYGVMTDNNNQPCVIDYTEQGKKAGLLEMGNAIEEGMISNYYAAHADDPVVEGDLSYFEEVAMFDNWKETREKTYNDAMTMEDYFTLDINVNEDMDLESFPEDLLVDDTTYEADSGSAVTYTNTDVKTDSSSAAEKETDGLSAEEQAAILKQAEALLAEKEKEKETQSDKNLPLILGLTALGGAAAGAGGRKVVEALKGKNVDVKDLMMRARQKLADVISPPEAYKQKHADTKKS